ncbi:competence protein ComEA [Fontibacillus phaseoli]|uniref:Competence protein ComEA n=2 Tax=Fontibacillus phaseoli TaxID=1416533 RepID=A0A369BPZ4_9BACL|nr:competence protein ComEA [Fontibacillus phaseoli]
MLLALGGSHPRGIEGWVPINESVASAMSAKDGSAAEVQAEPAKTQGGKATGENTPASAVAADAGNPSSAAPGTQEASEAAGTAVAPLGANGTAGTPAAPGTSGTSANPTEGDLQREQSGLISINTAGTTELQEIPGIGEKKAQAIIDYRNAHGPFKSVNELTEIKGIGDKMLEKMKPHIRL